ncbi:MAG: cytochrome C [Ignavibacteriae bacterium]|nr:MAG: cytochrome C [Ignavibacteriota bacterium]
MRKFIKHNFRLFVIASSAIFVLMIVWTVFGTRHTIVQPIEYNHKIHVEEADLICIDCHLSVETMSSAMIPNIEICQECHSDEPFTDSPEEIKLLKYIEEEEHIPWQKIYSVPDHVYFSHRRHVSIGDLECSNCHGNVEELESPAPYPSWEPTMDNCIDCHKQYKVTFDCLSCHR